MLTSPDHLIVIHMDRDSLQLNSFDLCIKSFLLFFYFLLFFFFFFLFTHHWQLSLDGGINYVSSFDGDVSSEAGVMWLRLVSLAMCTSTLKPARPAEVRATWMDSLLHPPPSPLLYALVSPGCAHPLNSGCVFSTPPLRGNWARAEKLKEGGNVCSMSSVVIS